ncbi:MAG TPA: flagellar basal-body rod protein FlgG, partial [candidate division Zixibacteria bacterium]|nr:flagellar basal-body rod protein FlgG [candidate division Zixibacteria bacterium]
ALFSAASGMYAQQLGVDTIANNLANVNTTGYKKSRVEFQDLIYQTLRSAGASSAEGILVPTELQIGHGVRPVAVQKNFSQGAPTATENPLDVAIMGDGFFQITLADGAIAYSRDGSFKINNEGTLVTSDGFILEPEISLPTDTTAVNISQDGIVSVMVVGSTEGQEVGQVELAKFINPAGLKNIGQNLYMPTEASGEPLLGAPGTEGFGQLNQGYLEASNVKVVEEMVNMIVAQRAYEINSKVIQTSDDMSQIANNLKR